MSRRAIRVAFVVPALFALSLSAQTYDLVPLDMSGIREAAVFGINERGDLVGQAMRGDSEISSPVVWRGTQAVVVGGEGVLGSATAANRWGDVVANVYSGRDTFAAVWTAGSLRRLIEIPGDVSARGLNDAGDVTGSYHLENGSSHAFRWSKGILTTLPDPDGAGWAGGLAINAHGDVAGYSLDRAVVWKGNEVIVLAPMAGATYAVGINDAGVAIGWWADGDFTRAVRWENGEAIDLTPAGSRFSVAFGINGAGDVVGAVEAPDGSGPRAVLWRNGATIDLNTRIRDPRGCTVHQALAINDRGQIAASGRCGAIVQPMRLDPRSDARRRGVAR